MISNNFMIGLILQKNTYIFIGAALLMLITAAFFIVQIQEVNAQSKEYVIDGKTYVYYDKGLPYQFFDTRSLTTSARASTEAIGREARALARLAAAQGKGFMFFGGCAFYLSQNGVAISERIPVESIARRMQPVGSRTSNVAVTRAAPVDRCKNIRDLQATIPAGYVDIGNGVCRLDTSLHVFCKPTVNIIRPNADVTFIGSVINGTGAITYTWQDAVNGSSLGSGNSIKRSFDTVGTKQVTVTAKDARGETDTRTCSVVVSTSEAATSSRINPVITLEGGGITNNSCEATWSAKDVDECFLSQEGFDDESVDLSGTKQVEPGTYRLRCAYYSFGAVEFVESERIICRRNPNIREN